MANVVSGFRIGMWVILVKCRRSELQRALCEDLIVLTALCISQVSILPLAGIFRLLFPRCSEENFIKAN